MDRQLSPEVVQKQKHRRIILIGGAAISIFIVFGAFRMFITPVVHLSEIQTATTERGDIEASITASGIVLPEFEEVIVSPVTSRIAKVYHNVGEVVKKGDVILSLDKSNDELLLSKMNEELASKQNQKKRMQLTIENTLIDLQTNYEIQKLKSESLHKSFENEKYLKTLGGTTEEMVKQAELNSQIAKLEIDHLRESIINKKASLQTEMIDQEYSINIYQKDLYEVIQRLGASDVKASNDGVIIWINDKIGSTVTNGSELIKLANLSSFKVEGTISEIYLKKLSLRGKVVVQVDDSLLTGIISAINPTVLNDAVKFTVMLDNKNSAALSSNKKVDLQIVTSHKRNVIRLPQSVLNNRSSSPYLFVVKGDKCLRKLVEMGESNFNYIEIEKGLEAGDVVIVSDMDDKMHLEKVKIKR